MRSKLNSKLRGEETPRLATMEQSIAVLKLALMAATKLQEAGGQQKMGDELQWELWKICRHINSEPGNRLAGLLAGPALGVIPMIDDLLLRTEAGLYNEKLSKEQRTELTELSEQFDFALALIYRNLGHLISWRAERTSSRPLL